jgi:hypothetical protein
MSQRAEGATPGRGPTRLSADDAASGSIHLNDPLAASGERHRPAPPLGGA